ncbi:hypothetical protein Hypma_014617 [Hypsizygus marmoreus]|uniref:Uncharacterized protein n=1 Tax=Hypsizygus marmoreus TaxID=39966 RepID=A0A369JIX1_HYPMA|nr:hypothetical protein Hypma_014617 [Hypsizygus marmoreus]
MQLACNYPRWLTNPLPDTCLNELRDLWAEHICLGKKWGSERPPQGLLDKAHHHIEARRALLEEPPCPTVQHPMSSPLRPTVHHQPNNRRVQSAPPISALTNTEVIELTDSEDKPGSLEARPIVEVIDLTNSDNRVGPSHVHPTRVPEIIDLTNSDDEAGPSHARPQGTKVIIGKEFFETGCEWRF